MHPDVRRISAERMVEWMDVQRDRRFFYAVDGDARMCKAPASLAADPHPHYCTDRMLGWVNQIAVAARAKHPEKRIFAAAYIETVKPPVLSKPEPNVLVLYWTRTDEISCGRDRTTYPERCRPRPMRPTHTRWPPRSKPLRERAGRSRGKLWNEQPPPRSPRTSRPGSSGTHSWTLRD